MITSERAVARTHLALCAETILDLYKHAIVKLDNTLWYVIARGIYIYYINSSENYI